MQKIEQFPGWGGQMDRLDAEHLLQSKPVGSYVLRHCDEIASAAVHELESANEIPIESYLCTVVEKGDRISDYLILKNDKGWTLYQDNPDLYDSDYKYFTSVYNLLADLRHLARYPVSP
jgi:hypothetical protein